MTRVLIAMTAALALLATACADAGTTGGEVTESPEATAATDEPTAPEAPEATADPEGDGALAELEAARQRWADLQLDSYTYRLERLCFCPPEYRGPYTITVADGEVTDIRLEDGGDLPSDIDDEVGTVDDLFDRIEETLTGEHEMADGDPEVTGGGYGEDGLPRELAIDPIPNAIDDEITYTAELLDEAPPTADPDATPATEELTYVCTGAPFTLDAVEGPGGPLEPPTPLARDAETVLGGPDLPDDGWHRTADDGQRVDWIWLDPTGEDPAIGLSFELVDDAWQVAAANYDCGPFLATDAGIAEWWVADPASVTPESTEIDVLLTERACASGQPATGRVQDPRIDADDEQVAVAYTITPVEGAATCQSNPPTPATLVLDEPLGDRALLDASTWPPRDALEPPLDQQ